MVGPAGAGKTRSVGAARSAWEASGVPVRGLAVSAVAAGVLAEEAGLASDTLAKFLFENAKPVPPRQWRLRAGEAVVLDEASMVATTDLARLVAAVVEAQAKLVLVGDHRQLGAVGAGGLFRLLVADTAAAELTDARRFVEPWEAAATLRLRRGDPTVVAEYERHGRLVGGSREEMVEAAFASWQRCRELGESVVVLAHDHGTVDALALRARAVRVAAGEVEPGGVAVGAQVAGVGDEVVTTDNDRRLVTSGGAWVRNGDRWVVTERRRDGSLVVEHADGRGRVVLPGHYVADHVALSYAVTVHKAQGLTVDRGVVVVDEAASAELVYVGMTRGRLGNQACLVLETGDEHGWRRPPTPAEALADALGRSGAERSATEVLRSELERSEDLAVLVPALIEARRLVNRGAGPDRHQELLERQAEFLRVDDVRSAAARRLHMAEEHVTKAQAALQASRVELDALGDRGGLFRRRAHVAAVEQAERTLEARLGRLGGLEAEAERARCALQGVERSFAESHGRYRELVAAQAARDAWLAEHPVEVAWMEDLAERVAERRSELALAAEEHPPAHVLRLLGPPPVERNARERWLGNAGAVESYREQWRVEPDQLGHDGNLRGVQAIAWEDLQLRLEAVEPPTPNWLQLAHPAPDRGLDLGL
ncbi:MAG: AAA family ATPase [Acidimicrobiales bacterium]